MATPTRSSASLAASQAPASSSSHSTRTGRRSPWSPLQEGLGERAHDRRHAHRGAPVAQVPLHPVTGRELVLRRAHARPHAVDVEEPVALARGPTARLAVDGLHEAPAEAGLHVELRAQEAQHGLVLAQRVEPAGAQLHATEVARHPQGRAAGALLPLAQPAAGQRERSEQGGRATPHGTSARSANERIRPSPRGHGAVAARRQRQPRHPVRVGGGRHAAGAHGRARRRLAATLVVVGAHACPPACRARRSAAARACAGSRPRAAGSRTRSPAGRAAGGRCRRRPPDRPRPRWRPGARPCRPSRSGPG